jgi:hypothetical protein
MRILIHTLSLSIFMANQFLTYKGVAWSIAKRQVIMGVDDREGVHITCTYPAHRAAGPT